MGTIKENNKILREDAQELSRLYKENNELSKEAIQNEKETNKLLKERGNIFTEYGRQIIEMQKTRHGIHEALLEENRLTKELEEKYGNITEEGKKSAISFINRKKTLDQLILTLREKKSNTTDVNEINKLSTSLNDAQDKLNRLKASTSGALSAGDINMLTELNTGNKEVYDNLLKMSNVQQVINNLERESAIQGEKKLLLAEKQKQKAEKINNVLQKSKEIGLDIFNAAKESALFYIDYQDKVYKSGRAIGFSNTQIEGQMAQVGKDLGTIGVKYGATADEIIAMQGRVAKATGKAVVMSYQQKDALISNSKIFGEEITDSTIEKMDNMGAGIEQAGAQLKAIQEGARYVGLDASKFAQSFTSNLEWAQKNVNFKDGVNGIRKMTEKSETLKINMQSILSAADKMNNVQGVIESSAKLQMLGGNFARNFSDPMRVMYESQSDPEALFNRIIDSVKGMSSFNTKTGVAETNYYGRASLKAASEASGIDYNELLQASQTKAKLQALGSQMNSNLTEEQKTAIANRAQLNTQTGRYEVSWYDKNGQTTPKDISQMTASDIKAMTDSAKKTEDINGNVYQMTGFTKTTSDAMIALKDVFISRVWSTLGAFNRMIIRAIEGILGWFKGPFGWFKKTATLLIGILTVSSTARSFTFKGLKTLFTYGKKGIAAAIRKIGSASFGNVATQAAVKGKNIFSHSDRLEPKNIRNIRADKMAEEVIENGRTAKGSSKFLNILKNGSKWSKGASAIGGVAAIFDAINGGIDASKGAQEEREASMSLESAGGLRGLKNDDRRKALAISSIAEANQRKTAGIAQMVGAGATIAANFMGPVGPFLSAAIGIAVPIFAKQLGKIFGKNNATVAIEEQSKDRGKNYLSDTTRLNMGDLSQSNVATATIKTTNMLTNIYEFMIQKWGTHAQKQAIDDGIRIAKGEKVDTNHGWFNSVWNRTKDSINSLTGGLLFANGGIVNTHAENGAIIHGKYEQGDREIIAANSGEMILNKKQQGALFSFINKLYDSPTEIAKRTAALHNNNINDGVVGGNFNLKLSGTIKLDAGGQTFDFKSLMNNPTFVKELSNIIIKQMSKNMNGKFDKNSPVSRTNSYTYRRGVGYNNA